MSEEWRPIPFAPGYEVSDQGRVRSWRRGNGQPSPHLLKPCPDRHGYPRVGLHTPDGKVNRSVHSLVMAAFVGPRPDGMETRHLDGTRTNSTLSNLAYGTHAENVADSIAHGTQAMARRTHCNHGHEFTPENTYRDLVTNKRICRKCRNGRQNKRRKALRAARGDAA